MKRGRSTRLAPSRPTATRQGRRLQCRCAVWPARGARLGGVHTAPTPRPRRPCTVREPATAPSVKEVVGWGSVGGRRRVIGGWRLVGTAQVQAEREGGESLPLGAVRRENDAQPTLRDVGLDRRADRRALDRGAAADSEQRVPRGRKPRGDEQVRHVEDGVRLDLNGVRLTLRRAPPHIPPQPTRGRLRSAHARYGHKRASAAGAGKQLPSRTHGRRCHT